MPYKIESSKSHSADPSAATSTPIDAKSNQNTTATNRDSLDVFHPFNYSIAAVNIFYNNPPNFIIDFSVINTK